MVTPMKQMEPMALKFPLISDIKAIRGITGEGLLPHLSLEDLSENCFLISGDKVEEKVKKGVEWVKGGNGTFQ